MSTGQQTPTHESRPSGDAEIGALVRERPEAAELFERLGLEYCCGGSRTLAEACDDRGLDPATVGVMVESLTEAPRGSLVDSHDVSAMSIAELCDHIVSVHHGSLRETLPHTGDLIDKVVHVHGDEDPGLSELERIFSELSRDFLDHADREEERLFPFCRELDRDPSRSGIDPELLELLEDEHSATGRALVELRALSHDYDPERAFCATHRAMMASLKELEVDTHLHVHEENNVLFPMVRSKLAVASS